MEEIYTKEEFEKVKDEVKKLTPSERLSLKIHVMTGKSLAPWVKKIDPVFWKYTLMYDKALKEVVE